jgi:DNA (cytosine-5)-methyltransferase 1
MDALQAMDALIKGEGLTFSNGETLYLRDFAAIHASPPCQGYSITNNIVSCKDKVYPKLIGEVRELLENSGKSFVIENVVGAPLNYSVVLCGLMFNLKVLRHRLFETNFYLMQPGHPYHRNTKIGKNGFCCVVAHNAVRGNSNYQYPNHKILWQAAMGIDWMTKYEMTQSIPPAYTEFIGSHLWHILIAKIEANSR